MMLVTGAFFWDPSLFACVFYTTTEIAILLYGDVVVGTVVDSLLYGDVVVVGIVDWFPHDNFF